MVDTCIPYLKDTHVTFGGFQWKTGPNFRKLTLLVCKHLYTYFCDYSLCWHESICPDLPSKLCTQRAAGNSSYTSWSGIFYICYALNSRETNLQVISANMNTDGSEVVLNMFVGFKSSSILVRNRNNYHEALCMFIQQKSHLLYKPMGKWEIYRHARNSLLFHSCCIDIKMPGQYRAFGISHLP